LADTFEIKNFLKEFKQAMKMSEVFFLNRPKNSIEHLADLGITANQRKDYLNELELKHYSQGPIEETQFGGGSYWVYGMYIEQVLIYIKITIINRTNAPMCISFHKAEDPLTLPYNNENI
jgi:hypothetical protein